MCVIQQWLKMVKALHNRYEINFIHVCELYIIYINIYKTGI